MAGLALEGPMPMAASSPTNDSDGGKETDMCYICLGTDGPMLVNVCKCTWSQIHPACFERLVEHSTTCRICRHEFAMPCAPSAPASPVGPLAAAPAAAPEAAPVAESQRIVLPFAALLVAFAVELLCGTVLLCLGLLRTRQECMTDHTRITVTCVGGYLVMHGGFAMLVAVIVTPPLAHR